MSSVNERHPDICLVIPPSSFLADQRVFPSLGPLSVAAQLKKQRYSVDVLDLSGIGNTDAVIAEYFRLTSPAFLGVTATTPQYPDAIATTREIRKHTNNPVIAGGPHFTMTHASYQIEHHQGTAGRGTRAFTQALDEFDTVVVGDGEKAIIEAMDAHSQKVIYAGGPDSPLFLTQEDLNAAPFPDRELIALDTYHYTIDGRDATSIYTQLGCPYGCAFCGGRDVPSFRRARLRPVAKIMEEVDNLVQVHHKTGFMFYDDELNAVRGHMEPLLQALIRYQQDHELELALRGFVRAKQFTQEQAGLMKQAGFEIVLIGIESANDQMLANMHKGATSQDNTQAVRYAHEAGLNVKALMSVGHPGESEQTIQDSLCWAQATLRRGDDIDWALITPYPGSFYYDRAVENPNQKGAWVYTVPKSGDSLICDEVDFATQQSAYKGKKGRYSSHVHTEFLTKSQLVWWRDHCEAVSRAALDLPPIQSVEAQLYDHSMGQPGIPSTILRSG